MFNDFKNFVIIADYPINKEDFNKLREKILYKLATISLPLSLHNHFKYDDDCVDRFTAEIANWVDKVHYTWRVKKHFSCLDEDKPLPFSEAEYFGTDICFPFFGYAEVFLKSGFRYIINFVDNMDSCVPRRMVA